jgi:hypothetical protein
VAGCCECGDEPSGSCAMELVRFLHAVKSYEMGPCINSPPKEGVLWIFITPESPSPWPSSNLQTLGPMASNLTVAPLR